VIYSSQRASNWLIYRQPLNPSSAPQLITPAGDKNFLVARLSPDGDSILLEGQAIGSHKIGLYRVGLKGGVPQLLFNTDGFVQFWCTNGAANLCVFGRPTAGTNELVLVAFAPLGGPGRELVRIPVEAGSSADIGFDYSWQLSPDGSQIGIVKEHGNQILLVPLGGGPTRTIRPKGHSDFIDLSWANDSQSMFVSSLEPGGANLLHVDLNGATQSVWEQSQATETWGFPSPDGRHLAIAGSSSESNVWSINNF